MKKTIITVSFYNKYLNCEETLDIVFPMGRKEALESFESPNGFSEIGENLKVLSIREYGRLMNFLNSIFK